MPNDDGVFGKQLHDPCQTDGCSQFTQHASGLCQKCRTYECGYCEAPFVANKALTARERFCAQCRRSKKRTLK